MSRLEHLIELSQKPHFNPHFVSNLHALKSHRDNVEDDAFQPHAIIQVDLS